MLAASAQEGVERIPIDGAELFEGVAGGGGAVARAERTTLQCVVAKVAFRAGASPALGSAGVTAGFSTTPPAL